MILRYLFVLCLVIWSQAPKAGEHDAVAEQVADVATTGAGLSIGAAEANPLGLALLGVKLAAYQHIKAQPPEEQPSLWGMFGAFGWGAAVNNLCVIASGGLCAVLGAAAGLFQWKRTEPERLRAQFDAICERERVQNPALQCVWSN